MRIYVTQKDIDTGSRGNYKFCPVALSLKRRGFKNVQVAATYVVIDYKIATLPFYAQQFISQFDQVPRYDVPKPFSFILDVEE